MTDTNGQPPVQGGGPPEQGPEKKDHNGTILIGVLLILAGLWVLGDSVLPTFTPAFGRFLTGLRNWGAAVALIIGGLFFILYGDKTEIKFPSKEQRLYRSESKHMIAGVIGGLSDYLGIDVTLLRLGVVAVGLLLNLGWVLLVAYIAAAVIVPKQPVPGQDQVASPAPPPAEAPSPPAPPAPPAPPEQ